MRLWLLATYLIGSLTGNYGDDIKEIVAEAGEEVLLSCPVNTPECGDFHSLKWYRDTSRVYVYSPAAQFSNAEGSLMDRCLDISQRSLGAACARGYLEVTNTNADLKISPVELPDHGEYRCEITYLDLSSNCPVVHFTNLKTIAAPEYVHISPTSSEDDLSGQVVGPYQEGLETEFRCTSGGGQPAPTVQWVLAEEKLAGEISVEENFLTADTTVTNKLKVKLRREHSGQKLTCIINHELLNEPMEASLQLDVNVGVKSVSVIQMSETTEKEEITLKCVASGGRPLPIIQWTTPVDVEFLTSESSSLLEDETFELTSLLTFPADAEHNGETVVCAAKNEVMEEALKEETVLDVLYSPRVAIEGENKTLTMGEALSVTCMIDANPTNISKVEWYLNNDIINLKDERIVNEISETSDTVTLTIEPVIPKDSGRYKCLVENIAGWSISTENFTLDVLYPPFVQLRIEPEEQISEEDHENMTLHCDAVDGNPLGLTQVFWFHNGDLIKQLPVPDCHEVLGNESDELIMEELLMNEVSSNSLCDIDPTKLELIGVTREMQGNYTCIGTNEAGEGPESDVQELVVYYLPGMATLIQDEEFPLKGSSIVLTCTVENLGHPEADSFLWTRNEEILDEKSENLTFNEVGITTQQNISCAAVNEIGSGDLDTVQLEVFVPPTFIKQLPQETSFLSSSDDFALSCQVECSPLCSIRWFKNEKELQKDTDLFLIEETIVLEDPETNTFSSVMSSLSWNLEVLPEKRLDHDELNFTISCTVDENEIGQGISSSSQITVEYAPENVEISAAFIEVEEGENIEPLLCYGDASPEANYVWRHNDKVITENQVLEFEGPSMRELAGDYFCHVSNKHGEMVSNMTLNVLFKPECTVSYTLKDDEIIMLCKADANPTDLTFRWAKYNKTLKEEESEEAESEISFKLLNESLGEYYCHVSNSLGEGEACVLEITDVLLTKGLTEDELIIIVAVAAAILALLLVIAIILCIYCARRGKDEKDEKTVMNQEKADNQPHPDRSFYENLPFHGLKQPPKEVISARLSQDMDYADADYKDLYVDGPLGYRKISENKANLNKNEANENGL